MQREYLFVYGTLRSEFGLALMNDLNHAFRLIGAGSVKAVMYDLGEYPGAVKEEKEEVVGDVLEVLDVEALTVLEEYEGAEYRRERTLVTLLSGENLVAWIYWYKGDLSPHSRIEHNDYLSYLKTKKDRFV